MKRIISTLTLTFVFVLTFGAQGKQPNNYFTEVDQVLQIKKLIEKIAPNHRYSFTLTGTLDVTGGNSKVDFDALTSTINAQMTAAPAPGMPAVKSNIILEEEIKEDLKSIIQLLYSTPENLQAVVNYQERFKHLPEIIQNLSNGTSLEGQSGFLDMAGGSFGFNESALIYGITDFALKRAKEELMEAHIKYLVARLDEDQFIPLMIPQTLKILHQFLEDDSWSYSKYGDLWKAAFQEDFRQMPMLLQNGQFLDQIIATIRVRVPTANQANYDLIMAQIKPAIMGCAELGMGIYQKQHPVSLLNTMAERYVADPLANPPIFNRTIMGTSILLTVAGSFKDNVYSPVSSESFRTMTDEGWQLLFKLIYLRNKVGLEKILGAVNAQAFLNIPSAQNIADLRSLFTDLVANAKSCQELLTNYKNSSATSAGIKELSFEEVRKLIDLSIRMNEQGLAILEKFAPTLIPPAFLTSYKTQVKPYIEDISQIAEGISTKQYGKVLNGMLDVIRQINIQLPTDAQGSSELSHTLQYLTKYGSFMVNILSAQNSEDVETSLKELIPKGQYKLKDATKFSVSLSLYPGGIGGVEWVKKYDTDSVGNQIKGTGKWNHKGSAAFYLPIGIDLNFGLKKGTSSFNIFVQALDLGAVMNYRINTESDEETNPELGFKQLLSPGLALMFHLPKSPVVLGGAFNYTPELRKIDTEGPSYKANAMRLGAFLSVDVTAIHIALAKKTIGIAKW